METENCLRRSPVICRTCLQQINDSTQTFYLNSPESDIQTATILSQLNDCLPELDLNVTLNVAICGHCLDALDFAYKFRKKCLKVEEYIISYVHKQDCRTAYVDLARVVQQNEDANYYNQSLPYSENAEQPEEPLLNFIKQEPDLDVKDETNFSNLEDEEFAPSIEPKQGIHTKIITKGARIDSCSKKDDSQIHIETISTPAGKRMHKCTECNYTSRKKSRLRLHVKVHTEDKPYKCTECDFSCKWKGYLKVHMSIHNGDKPYKCEQCSYSSNWKNGLIGHIRIHTGDKPYKCTECEFSSTSRAGLNYHLKIHN